PDHKPCRNSRPTTVAVQRRDLAVDEVPVDLARELHQVVPHVDDLVQPRAKQITRFYRLVLLRPHRFPPIRRPNHASRFEGILKMKLQAFRVSDPETLQSQLDQTARKRLSVSGLEVFHGRLITLLVGAAAAWPLAARAQQRGRIRRIWVLMNLTPDDAEVQARLAAFAQGLQEAGWAVGRNVRIDLRWGGGDPDSFRKQAAELVALTLDVVFPSGIPAATPLLQATRTVV